MEDFEAVYQSCYEDVFRFLRGLSGNEELAEELTQETFFRAMKSIDTYQGNANLRVWLCSIAKHLYYDHCKKQKRSVSLEEAGELADDGRHFSDMLADRTQALQIHKLLHDLREPYKEIFTLRVFGELSFREIGEIFGKSEHWACVTYHRARAMLQKLVQEGGMGESAAFARSEQSERSGKASPPRVPDLK